MKYLKKKIAQGVRKVLWGGPKCPRKKGNFRGEQCTFPKEGSKRPREKVDSLGSNVLAPGKSPSSLGRILF
jgi:radical SAM superfamily enzyme